MKQYAKINNITGFVVFLLAAIVYTLTIEPTASFWDCPEFITSAFKLEVGHPPGAPFFMLTGNFFAQFVSNPSKVAMMVNFMSGLMSAACIMFLFWTITYLVKKLFSSNPSEALTSNQIIITIGSGLVGAFAYMFSDTFWFSAVEGEVYAYSSLFTAVVFWLILKWDAAEDNPQADRWLILIAYLTGLSIGVHLLNLLCIPAIVMVYYFKKRPEAKFWNSILVLAFSLLLVAVVLYGLVPGVIKVGGAFDLFFVNVLGFSFNSGVLFYIALLIVVLAWALFTTQKEELTKGAIISFLASIAIVGIPFISTGYKSLVIGLVVLVALGCAIQFFKKSFTPRVLNTTVLCITFIMVGYSSYTLIVLRSLSNTPMDQNSPEDIFTLGSYLGREQYGTRPLFYGPAYSSYPEYDNNGNLVKSGFTTTYTPVVKKKDSDKDQYQKVEQYTDVKFAQNMLFPRMYSYKHQPYYEQWVDITGKSVPYYMHGEIYPVTIPTQFENMQFMLKYQVGYMYWRYFFWNFVGRQNDLQGQGDLDKGNWITGIPFVDNWAYGDQSKLPKDVKENKGHNVYYGLPFLLGLLGLLWQINYRRKGVQQFTVVFLLFFMTGLAIIFYLNQTPMQVRERDYAYAGSFYAYAIWIGMGVAGLAQIIRDLFKRDSKAIAFGVVAVSLLIPIQMGCQNWDDHDRSNRYFARDFGQNYFDSTQEKGNPIIFNNGDNDTFPLWYNQEVEGYRLDVRTCNFSYINIDWYIDQMKRPSYDGPALPITFPREFYGGDRYNAVNIDLNKKKEIQYRLKLAKEAEERGDSSKMKAFIQEYGEDPFSVQNVLKKWLQTNDPNRQVIPTDTLTIKIDKEAVKRSGMLIPEEYKDNLPDYMYISLKDKKYLTKGNLMLIDILANANWERPVYVAISVGSDEYLNLDKYLIQEGLAYRFTPFDMELVQKNKLAKLYPGIDLDKIPYQIPIDKDKMYDNLMNKFKFGGMDTEGVYIDENAMRMCLTHRRTFVQLASQLIESGELDKAKEVLQVCSEKIPASNVPHDFQSYSHTMAETYYVLDMQEEGDAIARTLADKSSAYIDWALSLSDSKLVTVLSNLQYNMNLLRNIVSTIDRYNLDLSKEYQEKMNEYNKKITHRINILKRGY